MYVLSTTYVAFDVFRNKITARTIKSNVHGCNFTSHQWTRCCQVPSDTDSDLPMSAVSTTADVESLASFQTSPLSPQHQLPSVLTLRSVPSGSGRRPTTSSYTTGTVVRTERKAVRVVGMMFAAFVACWTSFFVVNFVMGVCQSCHVDERVFKSFLWLGYTSSCVNPVIYTTFNRAFKRTFIRLLTCNTCRWLILHTPC